MVRCLTMAERRLRQLQKVLNPTLEIHTSSIARTSSRINIDGVNVTIGKPSHPELVPKLYLSNKPSQSLLYHLKWMISKDLIGQDMYLLGPPSPYCRHLALSFAELVSREVEHVTLSRDTTEVDLKQRREIVNNTVHYIDQAVVRAAVEGRVLILEGLEKAERNVLPILNNLLENREAQLDDGRFIVAHDRYDKLAMEHSHDLLNSWNLVRASDQFRVIAIGLPVPPYQGNTLDPPLRSRFQARHVLPAPFPEILEEFKQAYPSLSHESLSSLLSVAYTLHSLTRHNTDGPVNLTGHLHKLVTLLVKNPLADLSQLVYSIFPAKLLGMEQLLEGTLHKFQISSSRSPIVSKGNRYVEPDNQVQNFYSSGHVPDTSFVSLPFHQSLLEQMHQYQAVGDICVLGPKGSGKTALVNQLAQQLGYTTDSVVLYQDMTSRDLLQQRTTHSNGDTGWRLTPLLAAAQKGHMAVLDGMHRLEKSTASTLKRLIQDREIDLTDGTHLMRDDRYQEAMAAAGLTQQEMTERKIFPIHSKFRIVAVGEATPTQSNEWLSPEMLSMFQFIHVMSLPKNEERRLLQLKVPNLSESILDQLLDLTHSMRISDDPTMIALSSSLSTRQLIRIGTHLAHFPKDSNLYTAIHRACLSRFLPPVAKATLQRVLASHSIHPQPLDSLPKDIKYSISNGLLKIGNTQIPLYSSSDIAMIPDVTFYDNPMHIHLLEEMLKDYTLGEHLLLIGNQGVGKNKLADRFLHLLNAPREYLQLHRDSTVQTLTTQPSVTDGQISYQDSPLVRAVQYGRILVVDEADKAPTHVTAILRNIVNGEAITLSNGKKISPASHILCSLESADVIPVHPSFRMIVLANRPGFPFMGNDFYAAVGDCFSCHAIDNPDFISELSMVQQYGPNVSNDILEKLVSAFSELREMADEGKISYPYSTREVVNIVRHLQMFPNEGVSNIVRNVFDFDSYSSHLLDTVISTLHKHGIPVGANRSNVKLATKNPLPSLKLTNEFSIVTTQSQNLQHQDIPVNMKGQHQIPIQVLPCERDVIRSRLFSEIKCQWTIPLHETNFISSVCKGHSVSGPVFHLATGGLPSVYSLDLSTDKLSYVDLFDYLPSGRSLGQPLLSLSSLKSGPHSGKVLIHEGYTNLLYLLSPTDSTIRQVIIHSLPETNRFLGSWRGKKKEEVSIFTEDPNGTAVVIHQRGENRVNYLNFSQSHPLCHSVTLPCQVQSVWPISNGDWIISDINKRMYLLHKSSPNIFLPDILSPLTSANAEDQLVSLSSIPVPEAVYSSFHNSKFDLVNLTSTEKSPVACLTYNPQECIMKLYSVPEIDVSSSHCDDIAHFPDEGSVVTATITKTTPTNVQQSLSVFNIPNSAYWKIELPEQVSTLHSLPRTHARLIVVPLTKDNVLTVNERGAVSQVEIGHSALQRSLDEWYTMVGEGTDGKQLTLSRNSGLDVSNPKHGKVDPDNAPHVGGNTWAGGTGGRDTAGLGGKGGPYRLDSGHNVFQLSDEEKLAVPEEVKQAARELGQKALKERLQEIAMSKPDHDAFVQFRSRINKQVEMLKAILESAQSKSAERQWLRHQTSGDLDDRKLVDGLTGEKTVYKRRGDKEPEYGQVSSYPKCIRLVVDVSGSMYRFNGYDGRLERTLEAVLMVIEAFEAHREKFKLDIVGHSGDEVAIPFLSSEEPPSNEKEKMDILKAMHAHSQYCWTGDNTLKATKQAIAAASAEPTNDECYVVVLSDANFSRYYIDPREYSRLLTSHPRIQVFAVFIGSLGDEAIRLQEALPAGRSFVCMNNADLPIILRQILSSSVL